MSAIAGATSPALAGPVPPAAAVATGAVRPQALGGEITFRSLLWGPVTRGGRRPGEGLPASGGPSPASTSLLHAPLHPAAQGAHAPAGHATARERARSADEDDDDGRDGSPRRAHEAGPVSGGAGPVPAFAWMAPIAPPAPPPSPAATTQARASASLEELLPALVRRIAWSGDRHRGTVRLEIGAGELEGAVLVLHAEGSAVRLELDVPAGVDARLWQERLQRRLSDGGVAADAVEVR